jgi:beta-lactamase regulating signal transducer with metallopeptidase domain
MTFATALICKVLVATTIAVLAEAVRRRFARPELAYALWATVLAVLLVPSLVAIDIPTWVPISSESNSLNSVLGDNLTGFVVVVWLIGCGLVFWRQVRSLRILDRLLRFAAPAPGCVSDRSAAIASELRIRKCPLVVTADGKFSPFLWDPLFGQPRVVIPSELVERFSDEAIDAILRHELIHLRRRDAWRRRIEVVILALWWWFPTTWIARRRLRELEELCTDAAVLRAHPQGARTYARALLDTEEFLNRSATGDLFAVSAFARRTSLKARITRIVTREPKAETKWSQVLVAGCTLILLSLGMLTASFEPSHLTETQVQQASQSVERVVESQHAVVKSEPNALASGLKTFVEQSSISAKQEIFSIPDFESMTVHKFDREIVLTWSANDTSTERRRIRLIRVSDDGVEPRLWRIHADDPAAHGIERRELKRIFALLGRNNEIIGRDGTRHSYPGLVTMSDTHEDVRST